jgi:hypothetical protein
MERESPPKDHSSSVLAVGLLVTAVLVGALFILMGTTTYDSWGALIVGPALFIISLPALARQGQREQDPRLFWFLVFALLLKFAGAIIRQYVAVSVYGGAADAESYHNAGVEISERFRDGNFDHGLQDLSGADFMKFSTGIVYTIIGPTRLGGFLFYSWLGFWGLFLFYRAFRLAVPEGRARSYRNLIFLLPSFVFWPSSIGKEAWMMMTLGIAVFGAARALSGRTVRGLTVTILGLWLASLVRPHIAGLVAAALPAAYLLRRPSQKLRELAPVAKGLAIVVVGIIAIVVVIKADEYLRDSGIETRGGVESVLTQITTRTAGGGSSFVPSILESPQRTPVAIVTVLFRPFVFEAHNAQALAAALETMFLLALTVWRLPWVIAALKTMRRQPFVAFALVYGALYVLAYSGVANFGILVRQRVLLLPLFIVFLAIPPLRKQEPDQTHVRARTTPVER